MQGGPGGRRPAAVPAVEQVSGELFTLMYGSIVRQLITDLEDLDEVRVTLRPIGAYPALHTASCNVRCAMPQHVCTFLRSVSQPVAPAFCAVLPFIHSQRNRPPSNCRMLRR